MEEVKQDVTQTESSPVEQTAVETAVQPQQEETTQTTPTPTQVAEEMVPIHKVHEWKRKAEEAYERLPQLVEEKLRSVLNTQSTQQEPTIAQLELYKLQNADNPNAIAWAEEKKEEIRLKKFTGEIESRLNADKEKQRVEQVRKQSYDYVVNTYPELLVKDQSGNVIGWDNSHPMTQQINQLMQNKALADSPEGLMAAADIAWARLSRSNQAQHARKEQQLKAEVKDLQKRTLVEGGGKQNVQPIPAHRQAIDKLRQTGNMKDARAAVAELLKARGIGE